MNERRAVEAYRSGDVSIPEAAGIAGVSVGEWLEIGREEGLTYRLSPNDLEEDAETARKL